MWSLKFRLQRSPDDLAKRSALDLDPWPAPWALQRDASARPNAYTCRARMPPDGGIATKRVRPTTGGNPNLSKTGARPFSESNSHLSWPRIVHPRQRPPAELPCPKACTRDLRIGLNTDEAKNDCDRRQIQYGSCHDRLPVRCRRA